MTFEEALESIRQERESLGPELEALERPAAPPLAAIVSDRRAVASFRAQVDQWREDHPARAAEWDRIALREKALDAKELGLRQKVALWENAGKVLNREGVGALAWAACGRPEQTPPLQRTQRWFTENAWALLLLGSKGTGKTVAGAWAAQEVAREGGSLAWVRCLEEARTSMYGEGPTARAIHLRTARLLVLDDAGAEVITDPWRQMLTDVLDARYQAQRRTLVTSNLNAKQFEERYGARIWDRVCEGGGVFEWGGVSLRLAR